jgi:Cu(I)/Ag(I) efflux system periplasmic protein CusF
LYPEHVANALSPYILERNNPMKLLSIALLSSLLSFGVAAQTTAAPTASAKEAMPAKTMDSKDMTEAEVRKVDKDAKKVTLKHGPIKNLDMPSMTMVFQVRDPALLDKLVAGEKIMFTAEQLQGAFVMTSAEKVPPK